MYLYPDNLKARANLGLWELRNIWIIGIGLLISIFALIQIAFYLPLVLTAVYMLLTIKFDDTTILDFIKYATAFFITKQQTYYWRMR